VETSKKGQYFWISPPAGGFYAVGSSPAEFGKLLKSDYEFQGKLLKELGLTP
jgi:hypothetical protein